MHQSTNPSLSRTIWLRWATRQFLSLVIVQTLVPVTLWDNWGDERGCDEGHWHGHTRALPWGLPEVVVTLLLHCSWRRLLRWGLEFHVCTINKSAHTKKSGNLFNDPRISHYHRQVLLTARISLNLSLHPSLSSSVSGRSSKEHLVSAQSWSAYTGTSMCRGP